MKSDREFLQGVYEKAEELRLAKQTEINKSPWTKRKPAYLRYALAAAFVLIITSGTILKSFRPEKENITPQPYDLTRGLASIDINQQIWENTTDVIEVQNSEKNNSFEVIHVYKGYSEEKILLKEAEDYIIPLEDGQTAIILLQTSEDETVMLDVYYSNKEDGTYRNTWNDVLTKESLEEKLTE